MPIAHSMKKADWIVLLSKINRTIHFSRIYNFVNATTYIYNSIMREY